MVALYNRRVPVVATDDELGDAFVRVFRLRGVLDPTAAVPGLAASVSEIMALRRLQDGELTQQDLGAYLQLEKSTVSRLVEAMTAKGWVEKTRDPTNRRYQRIHLTPHGRRAARDVRHAMHRRHQRILAGLSSAERQAVTTGLAILVRALESETGTPEKQSE